MHVSFLLCSRLEHLRREAVAVGIGCQTGAVAIVSGKTLGRAGEEQGSLKPLTIHLLVFGTLQIFEPIRGLPSAASRRGVTLSHYEY